MGLIGIEEAIKQTLTIETLVGEATVEIFRQKNSKESCRNVMLVSHGWQIHPVATVPEPVAYGIPCFAYLVPTKYSLQRTCYDDWAVEASSKFRDASLAFATAGIPQQVVGAHYLESFDSNYSKTLAKALPSCDIAVLADFASKDQTWNQFAALPLVNLLHGKPALRASYSGFILHCCRPVWNPEKLMPEKDGVSTATGLYAYDDAFRSLFQ